MDLIYSNFIWDMGREVINVRKHGVDFWTAAEAFDDPLRKIFEDPKHSTQELRYFCIGKVGSRIVTVRFLYRHGKIRIFGAGYWRKGVNLYETQDRS